MTAIGVFCGARTGNQPWLLEVARDFGARLAHRGHSLVYGGGSLGLMGALADGALAESGEVIGVIPESMVAKERAHRGATAMHVVQTMAERKQRMMQLSDAYCTLPGGVGTLDELFEVVTAVQLGFENAPIGLLNVRGYFDPLIAMLDRMLEFELVGPATRERVIVEREAEAILDRLG
ncbi:MAG: TIGR00730 family Rossman fold protein [Phycisphaeraceae bacterium]|nr:TIGR00730 family Rossman fold protein [Phycisphaeraceae bacterium]